MSWFGKRARVGTRYHQKQAKDPSEPVWVAEVVEIINKFGVRYVRFFSWQEGTEMTPVERTVKETAFFRCYE